MKSCTFYKGFDVVSDLINDYFKELVLTHRLFHVFIVEVILNGHSRVTLVAELDVGLFAPRFLAVSMPTWGEGNWVCRDIPTETASKEEGQGFLSKQRVTIPFCSLSRESSIRWAFLSFLFFL